MRYQSGHTLRFLRSMPPALLAESLSVVPVFFGKPKGPEYYIFHPPQVLLEFLGEMSTASDEPVRTAARRALTKVRDSMQAKR
jgi:hypothetical protein